MRVLKYAFGAICFSVVGSPEILIKRLKIS